MRSRELRGSVRSFRKFNRRDPDSLDRVSIDVSVPLVRIGEVPEIHYLSDKEGELEHYYHEVRRPGVLYAHPDGSYMILIGGSTRVKDWLRESRANPETTLSRTNIERALRQYRRLSRSTKERIRDVRSYVAGLAWEIQRSRLEKYGRR